MPARSAWGQLPPLRSGFSGGLQPPVVPTGWRCSLCCRGCRSGWQGTDPCSDASQVPASCLLGQGWKCKPGNQVKPLHGWRSSAHPLLSCSLECAMWEALADCGIHLLIFFTIKVADSERVKIAWFYHWKNILCTWVTYTKHPLKI